MKTLFKNSKVWLGKNKFTEAVGFDSDSGKIIFTGTNHESEKNKHEFHEIIDLKQKLVLPAFTEGHCHFIEGTFENSKLNLRDASTAADFKNQIREYKNTNHSSWISGGYFSESNFKEGIALSRNFLDEICEDVPVIISRFDLHSAFANTKALEISGILKKIDEFTPEEIVKKNNNISGELKERARDFVLDSIPPAPINERTDIVLKQIEKMHSLGITAISDITLPHDLEIYKELINAGKLKLRVDSRLPFTEFERIENYRKEFAGLTDLIKFNSLKAFYDGSLSSMTAYMFDNYKNSNFNGIKTEYVNSGEFHRKALEIDKAGIQISVHAIGDKAVSELLDLNEAIIKQNGIRDRRFRIEHAQHIAEKDFQRFKDLNVIASVQPTHLFSDAKTASLLLNDYTTEHNYRKLYDTGSHICFGTDFPVVGESPFDTIYFAMTRKAEGFPDGFINENKFQLVQCLEAYTSENAYATFEENHRGSIEPGKFADIIVTEDDLFKMNADEIKDSKISMTYFNGKRVY